MAVNNVDLNTSALSGIAQIKKTNKKMALNLEQLSSGKKLVNASVSPSDLAIATGMQGQIRGYDVAVQNAQDTSNLIQTADSSLNTTTDILLRQRDIAVRASNEATLTDADRQNLDQEYQSLSQEIDRQAQAATFNTKNLRDGSYGSQPTQVGPNAGAENQVEVAIDDSTAGATGLNTNSTDVTTTANAQAALDRIDQALAQVSQQRAELGVTQRRLEHASNDAINTRINLDQARSRIEDTDFIKNISENNQLKIQAKLQSVLQSHVNFSQKSIAQLLQ